MLEEAYPDAIVRSLGGIYPDTEIITPTPDDSADCFNDYLSDAQRRLTHDSQFPNEPRQIKPGEDLHMDRDRVEVSGQVAVMSINGLLTKVIFDKNPLHEFYLEESFPLDWMYSHLTPFGIIMKINRQPVPEITQEIVDKDHAFWDQFSVRTIGNWITYDTTVKQVCDWAQDVYLRHDFHSFTGDRKFVHDDDAQKAFSKLRSSIGSSIYQWRSREANSKNPIERARVTREAEFAFKQALAYCPYSPEAVFHFMDLLLSQNRVDEALLILRTCHKLDPYNSQISDWIDQLSRDKLSNPNDDPNALMELANRYLRASDLVKSEQVLQRLATVMPNNSEALYNLAVIQAHRGETSLAVASLQKCLTLNAAEIVKDPKVINLRQHLFQDQNFVEFRGTPEFKTAFATNR
jgi:transposase-like protein